MTKGPSMVVIAEKLDAVTETVTTIAATVSDIRDKQLTADIHLKNIIGPPHLEERMVKYIDARVDHKQANSAQALLQVQTILQLEQKNASLVFEAQIKAVELQATNTEMERRANHDTNGKRFSRLERNMYFAMGVIAALQFILKFAFGK